MSGRLEKMGVVGGIGLAAGIAMVGVYKGRDIRTSLLIAVIATIAFVVALRFVLRRNWRETAIIAALAFVVTFVAESIIVRDADRYAMPYMQTNLMLTRLAVPATMLLGGSLVLKSLRSWKPWVVVLFATAVANVLSTALFDLGGWGTSGYFPFGATIVLPTAALFAAFGYVLADEAA